ncbi:MAG: hypothetical protein ACRDH5_00540 [bacterium]
MTEIFRIEASGVDPDLTEGLAARVADPLWYLARQWQLGEFRGEDAASPVIVEADIDSYPIDTYWSSKGPGGRETEETRADGGPPLEALVERDDADVHLTLRSRLESGAALFRKLRRAGFPKIFTAALMAEYGVTIARDVDRGDPVGLERLRILATASCDGQLLIDAIAEVGAPDKLKQLKVLDSAGQEAALKVLEAWLLDEGTLVLTVPDASLSAWQDRSQEYGFGVSASVPDTDPIRLLAREYPGGRLDWQHFDFLSGPEKYRPLNTQKLRVLATPLQFAGQPALRWWEMEEGEAYFGDLAGGEADLARSVLAAYAAVAGDDWFVLPCRVPAGSLSRVSSMRVLDNFGDWTTIRSTAAGDAADGDRVWKWFEISGNPDKDPGTTPLLFVPPVVNTTREGDVLEEVHFRRDEMANLAWAIETRYQGVWDRAVERTAPIVKPEPTPENPEDWTYQLGSEVPANWFPLVPVRIIGDSPQVVFRRGRMAHDPSKRQRSVPRGVLLLPGEPFLLDEAEVPLAGTRVTRRYQMARSADGGTHLWNARRKTPSSGPMSHSPLDYDALKGWPAAKGRR